MATYTTKKLSAGSFSVGSGSPLTITVPALTRWIITSLRIEGIHDGNGVSSVIAAGFYLFRCSEGATSTFPYKAITGDENFERAARGHIDLLEAQNVNLANNDIKTDVALGPHNSLVLEAGDTIVFGNTAVGAGHFAGTYHISGIEVV